MSQQFIQSLLARLGAAASAYAAVGMQQRNVSFTLISAMRYETLAVNDLEGSARLYIPHYWALYVHDGRQPFSMPHGEYMVWFRNPMEDPRLVAGKTPERKRQLKNLTPEQFRDALDKNAAHLAAGGTKKTKPVIITSHIRTKTSGKFFFSSDPAHDGGMAGFLNVANTVGATEARDYIKSQLKDVLSLKGTVTVRL